MNTMISFMRYFEAFEDAVANGNWDTVKACLAENVHYTVVNVPFACDLKGREKVVTGMQKSIGNFDAQLDERMLEIVSISRINPDEIRVELISGYQQGAEILRLPVSMNIKSESGLISEINDVYDPVWIEGATIWLERNASGLDPSYV